MRKKLARSTNIVALLSALLGITVSPRPVLAEIDAGARPVAEWLELLGKNVELFSHQFPSVTCTESVLQSKLGNHDKVAYEHGSVFDFLIFMNLQGEDLLVEESRILQKESGKPDSLPLLVTQGFSTLTLIFHPYFQGSFEFQLLDDEVLVGKTMARVRFSHIRGTRSTMALRVRGQVFPISLQGVAWIDPNSGSIPRITAELASPMEDVGLRVLRTDVRYAPIQFDSTQEVHWLPSVATIDLETPHQHWRNTHRFTNYRHFSVKSETKVK